MKTRLAITTVLLVLTTLTLQASILTGPITNTVNGHVYYLLTEDSWHNSETQSVALGGHLVTINDQVEQDWVLSTFGTFGGTNMSLWIGLTDELSEGTFAWVSGEPVVYTHWVSGEPNNHLNEDFVHMMKIGNIFGHLPGLWNDTTETGYEDPVWSPFHGVVEVIPPPVISICVASQGVEVSWTSLTNRMYQLRYCSELRTNVWSDLGSPLAGTGCSNSILDSLEPGQQTRFYRVFLLP